MLYHCWVFDHCLWAIDTIMIQWGSLLFRRQEEAKVKSGAAKNRRDDGRVKEVRRSSHATKKPVKMVEDAGDNYVEMTEEMEMSSVQGQQEVHEILTCRRRCTKQGWVSRTDPNRRSGFCPNFFRNGPDFFQDFGPVRIGIILHKFSFGWFVLHDLTFLGLHIAHFFACGVRYVSDFVITTIKKKTLN